eukprot:m.150831 g.150831  ORF g.150831 m.150831 type:complete len:210 (+) comp16322_c0_seq6:186-815(+)
MAVQLSKLDHSFDALDLTSEQLQSLAIDILCENKAESALHTDHSLLSSFVVAVANRYNETSFHNFAHAVTVLHMTHLHLQLVVTKLPSLDHVILLLSALCHDLDHRGLANSYYVNTKDELAIKYDNEHVLENHHVDVTKTLLRTTNLLAGLETQQQEHIEASLSACILATDMAAHGELASKVVRQSDMNSCLHLQQCDACVLCLRYVTL